MFSTQMVNTNYLELVRIKFVAGFRVRVCSDVAFLVYYLGNFFTFLFLHLRFKCMCNLQFMAVKVFSKI